MMPLFTEAAWWDRFAGLFCPRRTASAPVVPSSRSRGRIRIVGRAGWCSDSARSPVVRSPSPSPIRPLRRIQPPRLRDVPPCGSDAHDAARGRDRGARAVGARACPPGRHPGRRTLVDVAALATIVALLVALPAPGDHAVEPRLPLRQPTGASSARPAAADIGVPPGDRVDLQGSSVGPCSVSACSGTTSRSSRRLGIFLSAVTGTEPPRVDRDAAVQRRRAGPAQLAHPELDLVAVRSIVAPVSAIPRAGVPGGPRSPVSDLVTTNCALPRSAVGRVRFAPDDTARSARSSSTVDGRTEVVLVGEPITDDDAPSPPRPSIPAGPDRDRQPEHVVVEVNVTARLLVLADAFAPGWEAFVEDGRAGVAGEPAGARRGAACGRSPGGAPLSRPGVRTRRDVCGGDVGHGPPCARRRSPRRLVVGAESGDRCAPTGGKPLPLLR